MSEGTPEVILGGISEGTSGRFPGKNPGEIPEGISGRMFVFLEEYLVGFLKDFQA